MLRNIVAARSVVSWGPFPFESFDNPRGRTKIREEGGILSPSNEIRRVLVADDEPQIGLLIREALGQEGHPVEIVRDGAAALEKTAEQKFGLLVLDVLMPRMTGVEVINELRARGDEVPIVLMSSFLSDEVLKACEGHSRLAFLQKPFSLADLRAAVQRAINHARC